MGAKVLTPIQQRFVLERLAAGDASPAIVHALYEQGVLVSEQVVDYYRKRHRSEIVAAAGEEKHLVLHTGYAQRGRRVRALAEIVNRCEAALGGEDLPYLWQDTLLLVREMRQALDQIREEMDDIEPALSASVILRSGGDDISLRLSHEQLRALIAESAPSPALVAGFLSSEGHRTVPTVHAEVVEHHDGNLEERHIGGSAEEASYPARRLGPIHQVHAVEADKIDLTVLVQSAHPHDMRTRKPEAR